MRYPAKKINGKRTTIIKMVISVFLFTMMSLVLNPIEAKANHLPKHGVECFPNSYYSLHQFTYKKPKCYVHNPKKQDEAKEFQLVLNPGQDSMGNSCKVNTIMGYDNNDRRMDSLWEQTIELKILKERESESWEALEVERELTLTMPPHSWLEFEAECSSLGEYEEGDELMNLEIWDINPEEILIFEE